MDAGEKSKYFGYLKAKFCSFSSGKKLFLIFQQSQLFLNHH